VIQPIVEGHGEVEALPILLRRLQAQAEAYAIRIGSPIRRHRSDLVKEETLATAIDLASRQEGCSSILVLFDGDDDCPRDLAPRVQAWAQKSAGKRTCHVVMAHREYEAWFLAAVETLRGERGIRRDAVAPPDPEAPGGAKGVLEGLMDSGANYHATADQPALSALFDMSVAHRRSRSFRRLVSAFGHCLRAEGAKVAVWPPASW
jgi:hypothetical protein